MLHLTFAIGLSDLSDFMGFVRDHPDFFQGMLWFCYGFVMVSLWFFDDFYDCYGNVMVCYGFYSCVKSEVSITQYLEGLEQIDKIGY